MSLRGFFLALGVFALFLLIFVPIVRIVLRGGDERIDAQRMRRVYVALSLYEMEHDGHPAPNLALVRRDVDPSDFQSVQDPHVPSDASVGDARAGFPLDPARPELALRSPMRVSWSYRGHWPEAGRSGLPPSDPRGGLLASWWSGSIDRTSPTGAGCTGPVLRIAPSGALLRVDRRVRDRLTFADLFGK